MGMENVISEPNENLKSQEELELDAVLEESDDDDISEVDPDEMNEILGINNVEPEVINIESDDEENQEDQKVPDLKSQTETQDKTKETTPENSTLYSSKKVVIISFDEYMRRYNLILEHVNRSKDHHDSKQE